MQKFKTAHKKTYYETDSYLMTLWGTQYYKVYDIRVNFCWRVRIFFHQKLFFSDLRGKEEGNARKKRTPIV